MVKPQQALIKTAEKTRGLSKIQDREMKECRICMGVVNK